MGVVGLGFDLMTAVRTYRTLHDPEDRTMAAGPPLLILDGRRQPPITPLAQSVAVAMALRDLNPWTNAAVRFPGREEREG